jgi:hypothetical protein
VGERDVAGEGERASVGERAGVGVGMGVGEGAGDLAAVQRFVADAVHAGGPAAEDSARAARVEALVAPSVRGMRPVDRLEVYREQFWLRHLKSLEDDYPTLAWALGGSDALRELATQYLAACPPRTWDLQKLGADVPAFVGAHARWGSDMLARDAARIDWAFVEAFDTPDAPPFDPRVLASTPEEAWPGARIVLHPSVRLLRLVHPVHEVRDAVKRGESPTRAVASQKTHVVVWRDLACWLRSAPVEALAFDLLATLQAGTPLGEACAAVAQAAGEGDSGGAAASLEAQLGGWFQQWTASAWIASVQFGG